MATQYTSSPAVAEKPRDASCTSDSDYRCVIIIIIIIIIIIFV